MLFLFDYDGVIADSFDSLLDVCIRAQSAIGEGREPTANDFRTIRNLTFEELGRIIGISADKCVAYGESVFDFQRDGWQPRAFPEVVDVIPKLAAQHAVAVVTNSQSHIVAAALDEFGIGSSVTAVRGGESGETKVERIKHLQSIHGSVAAATWMIGDTIGDILAGKDAGVRTAAVTWGFQDSDLLEEEEPDRLLNHPNELLSLARM